MYDGWPGLNGYEDTEFTVFISTHDMKYITSKVLIIELVLKLSKSLPLCFYSHNKSLSFHSHLFDRNSPYLVDVMLIKSYCKDRMSLIFLIRQI